MCPPNPKGFLASLWVKLMPSSHSSLVSLFSSRFFLARGFWKKDGFRNCETVIATVTRGSDDGDDDDDDDDDGDDDDDNDYGKCNSYYDALRYNQQTIASQPQALVC